MRANKNQQLASYSGVQLFNLDVQQVLERESYSIMGEPSAEYGLRPHEVQAFKKQLEN